jgi:hypothetical protein
MKTLTPGLAVLLALLASSDVASPAQGVAAAGRARHSAVAQVELDPTAQAGAVASSMQELLRENATVRERISAISVLERLGTAAAETIPVLEMAVTNRVADVAFAAYRALGFIRNELPLDESSLRAGGAPVFLGRDGFRAFAALYEGVLPNDVAAALLRDVLRTNPSVPVQIMALNEMGRLQPGDPASVTLILDRMASPHGLVFSNAALALASVPLDNHWTKEAVLTALIGKPDAVAVEAGKALARTTLTPAQMRRIVESLLHSSGRTDFRRIGAHLHVLRALGREASSTAPALAALLGESSQIYEGRPSFLAKSIRRYLLLTLSEIGVPQEAVPTILDELTNALEPANTAAAARAAGAVTNDQAQIAFHLKLALARKGLDGGVVLETIESKAPPVIPPATSPYIEIIRALAKFGPAGRVAVPELRERAGDAVRRSPMYPAHQHEARTLAKKLSP